jgi:large subunit ribosomal protein L13
MDMNKAFFLKKEDSNPAWHVIDAQGLVLGRLATMIADKLRGKDKAFFTPHADAGDYVVVLNADKVVLTGKKMRIKIYATYSGWIGGLKEISAQDMLKRDPAHLIEHAVKGMLPKNILSRQLMLKLKVYTGTTHPHVAQAPIEWKLTNEEMGHYAPLGFKR